MEQPKESGIKLDLKLAKKDEGRDLLFKKRRICGFFFLNQFASDDVYKCKVFPKFKTDDA